MIRVPAEAEKNIKSAAEDNFLMRQNILWQQKFRRNLMNKLTAQYAHRI